MKACIVTIGDEILIGQIIDSNSVWLSQQLTSLGIDVVRMMSISDDDQAIISALDECLALSDIILLTGGLGPTKDDITKKSLAQYFNRDMVFDQGLFNKICSYFNKTGIPVTELHRQQCYMPSDIVSLENNMGTAPGMIFKEGSKWIVSMPGVPYEMQHIFSEALLPELKEVIPSLDSIYYRTIRTAGVGETRLAELISDIIDDFPKQISLAYLPSLGHVKLRLTTKEAYEYSQKLDAFVDRISERLGIKVYGYDNILLEEALKRDFEKAGLMLATAESCTGGFLGHRITSIPGSSSYFLGSIVCYSNDLKNKLLGVKSQTLKSHGAVSEETVLEMLEGVLNITGADIGVSVSGIAGPIGGTVEKPVGTIWMAWGNKENKKTRKLQLSKDRLKNIEYSSVAAMNSLRLFLTEL